MRYLNKIIFINSAHIPYAEIKLDGNVHFIGTQGVGKSTLLRAILFFYNADKSKLGIRTQDKQKSYDEFYFPYQNSYIVYEVCRENGNFFVVTFINNGRVAFRIVDCSYEKRFFIEEDNSVRFEWGKISEQIGTAVFRSNIIRGYEEFRDIIYGNIQNVSVELRRFNLMESSRYQNIPRTIQNIFLNQKLESRVIKDTIIDSMDFGRDYIDLNFYREYVKDFRRQYEDIWKWFKKDKNGKIKVKSDAEKVIEEYSQYQVTCNSIKELCAKLNYAFERDTEKLPMTEDNIVSLSKELARQERLLNEEKDKYNKERDELKGQEAVINEFLRQVKAKRQYYAEIDIDSIIERILKESELLIRKRSLSQQENILTDKSHGIKMRYDALLSEVSNSLKESELQSKQRIIEIESKKTQEITDLQNKFRIKTTELDSDYQRKIDEIQQEIDSVRQEMTDIKLQRERIYQSNPFDEQIKELHDSIDELKNKMLSLTQQQAENQQEILRITNNAESERNELQNVCEKKILKIKHSKESTEEEISKIKELLDRQKGSFIEWLDGNMQDWKNTIGKVVDDDVLYSTSLEPQKADSPANLYGVRIELQNISKTIKTPDELRSLIEGLIQKNKSFDKDIVEIKKKLESDIEMLERNPNTKLKALRFRNIDIEAELRQIPVRIKNKQQGIEEFLSKLENWRKNKLESFLKELGEVEEKLGRLKRMKQEAAVKKQKESDELLKSFERKRTTAELTAKNDKYEILASQKRKEKETVVRKQEIEALMNSELKGAGVDVDRLSDISRELNAVKDELYFIESHKADFYTWQNDKKIFFDEESIKKEEKKHLLDKLQNLQYKFECRKEKKEKEWKILSDELRQNREEAEELRTSIGKVRNFITSQSCPEGMSDAGTEETQVPLSDILDNLRDSIAFRQQKMDKFKEAVTVFKSNFSPENTFSFKTEFNTDSDYIEFASVLNEFILNNKIEKYRLYTSRQYANIIKRIAKEVGDLSQHNADIKSTINEIRRDFRENNFAGVIKEIDLKAVECNDELVLQLIKIKNFDEEHGFNIGELNLFSTEETLNRRNEEAVKLLMELIDKMDVERKRDKITLSDTFNLQFKVRENDNDTNWVERLSNVGSDGTDILVKSMINIMLISVFKRKNSQRFGDFKLHCMMDEIGKLHPDNVEGILKFANIRNIFLINSSPTTYNAQVYKYTYSLSKDEKSNTVVKTLLTVR